LSAQKIEIRDECEFYRIDGAKVLVVLLHAYTLTPRKMQRVAEVVREEYECSDLYVPKLPVSMLSWADPDNIAIGIVEYLTNLQSIGDYEQIILVGHSLGAVLARKVWVLALGATPDGGHDPEKARPWADKIERIVLLAALNRGWVISSALQPLVRLGWTLGTIWGNLCRHVLGREPLIFAFRRGAPFLTTVRLQCLSAADNAGERTPLTIQLLGTADDFVAPTDNLDLATGQDFYYLEASDATHSGIVNLDEGSGPKASLPSFRLAIKGTPEELRDRSLRKEDVFDIYDEATDNQDIMRLPAQNLIVRHLVFVIHGIRDRGFWTRRIAREVKSLARRLGQPCRAVTSTYGYFPMGPFLLPWMRRSKVEWLLDQYVSAKSLYPNAVFSYIGHSNGTYLLAKALEICPTIKFQRVVFGGSVVQRRFQWTRYLQRQQVTGVLNYVATKDWVVAIFPQGLEQMKLQDLGGAGHLGFTTQSSANNPSVADFRYVEGGHGASLASARWKEMAEFILNGTSPPAPSAVPPQDPTTLWLGRSAPLIWLLLAIVIFAIGLCLLWPLGLTGSILALAFALYLYLLFVVLTRA
jgi:pimeloyl-ACP methyl ester carboxylesterase